MEYIIKCEPITVKRHQVTAIHLIAALLMIAMGITAFVAPFAINIFNAGKEQNFQEFNIINIIGGILAIIGFLILIATIFFNKKWISDQKNLWIRIVELIAFTMIFVYCILQKWYLPTVYSGIALIGILVSYFLEKRNNQPRTIIINDKGIQLKNALKSTFWKWTQLEKAFIKHNVFTIIDTNNKMYQIIIDKNIDINNINTFNEKNIKAEIPNRIKDNW